MIFIILEEITIELFSLPIKKPFTICLDICNEKIDENTVNNSLEII